MIKFDAVVIGAGNAGLIAANTMQMKGMKVCLLEQHNLPGGFASSFKRGRFEFEPAMHEPCDIGENMQGGAGKIFTNIGINIDWQKIPDEAYHIFIKEGKYAGLEISMPFGIESYIKKCEYYVPGCEKSVRNFMDLCGEVMEVYNLISESKGKIDKKYLIKTYPNFLKSISYSLEQVMNACKIPEKAQIILAGYHCYLGTEPSRLAFNIYSAMLLKYLEEGVVIPKNRSHEISLALVEKFRERGGKVLFNTKATKIHVKDNETVGVETDEGDYIETNHVIANTSPIQVFNNMVYPKNEVPEIAMKDINAHKISGSGYVAYWGLNKTAKEIGIKDYSYFIYKKSDMNFNILSPKIDELKGQAIVCLNNAISDASPEGTCMISSTTLFDKDAWNGISETDYEEAKSKMAEIMLKEIEETLGVSIAPYVEEYEAATPMTFARYANSYAGNIYGTEMVDWDSLIARIMAFPKEQWIKGLRIVGGWGFRGMGYSATYTSGEIQGNLSYAEWKNKEGK